MSTTALTWTALCGKFMHFYTSQWSMWVNFTHLFPTTIKPSEMRRPGTGENSSGGYTYYWSRGSCRHLQPFVTKVIPVDEHIMQEAETHFRFHASCSNVCSYRDVWNWREGGQCQTQLTIRLVPLLGHTHCPGQLQCYYWHWQGCLWFVCWSPWFWYQ